MENRLPLVILLTLWHSAAQQIPTPSNTAPAGQPEQSQAHDSVMRFLQGVRLGALPEGKQILTETQWISGRADRGSNYYSRPEYTEVASLYAAFFDTDIRSVQGYKEFFDMTAVTKAGTSRHLKFLVISLKDTLSGKWKILATFDDADGDQSGFDFDRNIEYFGKHLSDTEYKSARGNYATYGERLLFAGRIREAKAAFETARTVSPISAFDAGLNRPGDQVRDIQIDALLAVIASIVPKAERDKKGASRGDE